jgi:hypothetical protein
VVDIFTALIGIGSICALTEAVIKILLTPTNVWEEDEDGLTDKLEAVTDYNEVRKTNPHIWKD